MPSRIFVMSNCQTAGVAAGLQSIFPNSLITAMPQPHESDPSSVAQVLEHLIPADVWVKNRGNAKLLADPQIAPLLRDKCLIDLPNTGFWAFHPDCVTARSRRTREIVRPFLSSRIVCWGYRQGISPQKLRLFFCYDIFKDLGYLDLWDQSVERLRKNFELVQFDFSTFFLRVKRSGVFMHTPGHPSIEYLFTLSKVTALKLGRDLSVMQMATVLPDGLAVGPYWPVYPEIGDALGVNSSLYWRTNTNSYHDLQSFIELSYENYGTAGIAASDLQVDETIGEDRILEHWSERL